jgi:hypothetical protein
MRAALVLAFYRAARGAGISRARARMMTLKVIYASDT